MNRDGRDVVRWNFLRVNAGWVWQRVYADGTSEEASRPLDFGKAIADAIRNGFRPHREYWTLVDNEFTTHFEPGAEPRVVNRRDDQGDSL